MSASILSTLQILTPLILELYQVGTISVPFLQMGTLRQLVSSRAGIGAQAGWEFMLPTLLPRASLYKPEPCTVLLTSNFLIHPNSPPFGGGLAIPVFFALTYMLVCGGAELSGPKVSALYRGSHTQNGDMLSRNNKKEYLKGGGLKKTFKNNMEF